MTNDFDFYVFKVTAKTKAEFKNTKVPKDKITRKFLGWKSYGRSPATFKQFKVYGYEAILGYLDAPRANPEKVNAYAEKLNTEFGVKVHVSYHIDD